MYAQKTVGLLTYDDTAFQPGYNLMFPHNQSSVYLLDNCGRVVNSWEQPSDRRPGNSVELMENGDIIFASRPADFSADRIWAGGGGMYVARHTWDNIPVWEYALNDSMNRLHHDIVVMPNGNVLAIAWEVIEIAGMLQAGRDTAAIPTTELWPDWILELEPDGNGGANIVWEWHAWDHLIQDFDANGDNFGVVADHPERIDVNYYDSSPAIEDWHHSNAIDYNPTLDQIALSVPAFNEIWIIDHSTTTAEAAGTTGGNSGRGGDLLYRWGNPAAYQMGDSTTQQLFFQHDVQWIDDHLDSTVADFGKIGVFNNRVGSDFSTVNIINQPWDASTSSYTMSSGVFLPTGFDWTYSTTPPQDMWSTGLSGLQRLPNGNTLILIGRFGRAIEITPNENIVWEYKQPLVQGNAASQGDTLNVNQNLTFRMDRYMPDYPAFANRTLVSGDYLEVNPDTTICTLPVVAADDVVERAVTMYPNPTTGWLSLQRETGRPATVEVYDVVGHRVRQAEISGLNPKIDLRGLQRGIYFVRLDQTSVGKVMVSE